MRETRTLEYKRDYTKTCLKTVSAFANYGTGRIVFGISDDGQILGISDPIRTCQQIENAINDSLEPVPDFTLSINEHDKTIDLVVNRGSDTPYTYRGKAYRRSDSSTVEVSRAEYNQLMLQGLNRTYDSLDSRKQDLDFAWLDREFEEKLGLSAKDKASLVSLELMNPDGNYTNAGALIADKNDFPGIDMALFGDSLNIIRSRHCFSKISLLHQQERALAMFDEHYFYEEISGMDRIGRFTIPREAFREAVSNALVHRR